MLDVITISSKKPALRPQVSLVSYSLGAFPSYPMHTFILALTMSHRNC